MILEVYDCKALKCSVIRRKPSVEVTIAISIKQALLETECNRMWTEEDLTKATEQTHGTEAT